MDQPKRIIVRSPNWIGDHVMALPFYRGLRRVYGGSQITLLCTENVAGLRYDGVFDDTWVLSQSERKSFKGLWNFSKKIRKARFDLAISLPASLSSALLFFLAAVPERVGFRYGGSGFFWTASLKWQGVEARQSKPSLYLQLLEFLSASHFEEERENLPPKTAQEKLIVVAPTASIALREWPYFKELLDRLLAKFPDYRIVLVGAPTDGNWRHYEADHVENVIGQTSLAQLREWCEKASLVIANDSGAAHIAATLARAPTLVLFGPGAPQYVTPRGPQVHVARVENLPCSPCEKAECRAPFGYKRCLKDLSVDSVWGKLSQLLPSIHQPRTLL